MNYLIAVSGSIAAYKSYDLTRLLVKQGHKVKVILTRGALEFIKPETFRYLGALEVYSPEDDFNPSKLSQEQTVVHIQLAKWADKLIVAPLSANTLGRLALGLNNDLLGSVFLALGSRPVLFFPAMNTQMWNHPRVKEHIESLKRLPHVAIINPISGVLACGDIGEGKFPEVEAVFELIETLNPNKKTHQKIVITAGATASPLDPVRYLTNPSTGLMGMQIAKAFLSAGHEVTVLAGHQCTPKIEYLLGHPGFKLIKAPTTELMKIAALENFKDANAYISTGAIADIEFDTSETKIKKETMGNSLSFRKAADILKEVLDIKRPGQKVISFAAETDTTQEVFREKMKRKPVDLMIGNPVANGLIGGDQIKGFQQPQGEYYFVTTDSIKGPEAMSKLDLGHRIVEWYESH